MFRAMKDTNLGYFAHALQLVVCDGVLSQRAVIDVLTICRSIASQLKNLGLSQLHFENIILLAVLTYPITATLYRA